MIISQLNNDQFIAAFGQHEYVRGFSAEAIDYILEFIEEQQREALAEGWRVDTQLTDYFQGAEELTPEELAKQYAHDDYDDVENIAEENNYTQLSNGNYVTV